MKTKHLTLLFLAALTVLLTACPYQSDVPIDKPVIKIDKAILGIWAKPNDIEKENHNFYDIQKIDKVKYSVVNNEYNTTDSAFTQTKYIAHLSKVGDLMFMNMQKNGEGDYYIHRIDIGKEEFTLFEVTDNIDEKFTISKDFKEFVKKNMHLSFFYNKDEKKYIKEK